MEATTEIETDNHETESPEFVGTATYSPEDNKLRLYAFQRLDSETYEKVKKAGFAWAPKQEIFVAPMWTPSREDLLLELCGEIGDEDKTLAQRAEERSERFEDLSAKRAQDAESAHRASGAIAERFAGGQPILIGHHSERKARKDAQRIENGMRKAASMWETSAHWEYRAKAALRHANYKERPDVRWRRIKGLEAEARKQERELAKRAERLRVLEKFGNKMATGGFTETPLTPGQILSALMERHSFGWHDGASSKLAKGEAWEPIFAEYLEAYRKPDVWTNRWLSHFQNRIAYEKAMLGEQGAIVLEAQTWDIQPGGRVLVGSEWCAVVRVTRRDGKILSVRCVRRYVPIVSIEEIKGYEAPSEQDAATAKSAKALGPVVNVRIEGCKEMTSAEWKRDSKRFDSYGNKKYPATEKHGAYRRREIWGHHWEEGPFKGWCGMPVFLTDEKEIPVPAPAGTTRAAAMEQLMPKVDGITQLVDVMEKQQARAERAAAGPTAREKAQELREALKTGIQVVTAPQLFPTPSDLAARMVEIADIQPGYSVLEPSAGTGAILGAMGGRMFGPMEKTGSVVAVEINEKLCGRLRGEFPKTRVLCQDFIEFPTEEKFDRILMNPPFVNGSDIRHILKARDLLKPGGVLVAICAGGPRQKTALEPLADLWEPLPAGTFQESGTNVSTVLLTITN